MIRIVISLILCVTFANMVKAQEIKEFRLTAARPLLEQYELLEVVKEMYARAGIKIHIIPMPLKRSTYENTTGISDGELFRIKNFNKDKEHLLRVPIPIGYIEIHLFAYKGDTSITLDNYCEHRVAMIKDAILVRQMLNNCQEVEVFEVDSIERLLKFIKYGRTNVGIADQFITLNMIEKQNETDIVSLGPLKKFPVYHFLNIKHKT